MLREIANGIKNFFQRLYGVILGLYFGAIITAAIVLCVLLPVIALPVMVAAVAVTAVSLAVLNVIHGAANSFFGLFSSKPKAEKFDSAAPSEKSVPGSTHQMKSALETKPVISKSTKTVLINDNTAGPNHVRLDTGYKFGFAKDAAASNDAQEVSARRTLR